MRLFRHREMRSQPRDTRNLPPRIWLTVLRRLVLAIVWIGLAPFAKVDATRQFTDDGEVCASAHFGFQWGAFSQGFGGEEAWAQIGVGLKRFAELEEALFWSDFAGAVFGTADGAEEDGISVLGRG